MSLPTCFFAYPSKPDSLAETVELAINQINGTSTAQVVSWKNLTVGGKLVITEICKTITNCDVFLCDLTHLNHNVLFEFGYALALGKRTCLFLDTSIERSKTDFDRFNLSTVGYVTYRNSHDITNGFFREDPCSDIGHSLYKEIIESALRNTQWTTGILYLKSPIDTDASIVLSRQMQASSMRLTIDDPQEVRMRNFSWYVTESHQAFTTIGHLLSQEQSGWKLHNAKVSFVSGISYGLGKSILMLAQEPYESPIDYRELLIPHSTAKACEDATKNWLAQVEQDYQNRITVPEKMRENARARTVLSQIQMGDFVAEQESDELSGYFVHTPAYDEAFNSRYIIFLGRKGAGKSAILFKLKSEVSADIRNHVCVIKPVAYELSGIQRMLKQSLHFSERGYLIESFWKFLLYTELARSVYDMLSAKPLYYEMSEKETKLTELVELYKELVLPEFSIRLENIIAQLHNINSNGSASQQRVRISELLHNQIIWRFGKALGSYFADKNNVFILIDNLDKTWKQDDDIEITSELLLGLLSVSHRINEELNKSAGRRESVDIALVVFLRSDIFSHILKYARERDKIRYYRIIWDDPELLLRVIEDRILSSLEQTYDKEGLWSTFFCSDVEGKDTRRFILDSILLRPRDIIFLVKTALTNAVSRGHTKIDEGDLIDAQKRYSQYALDSLIVENGIAVEDFERLLYEFVGLPEVITTKQIVEAVRASNIEGANPDNIIQMLCERSFLGREVKKDLYRFQYSFADNEKLEVMARKTAESRGTEERRFRIGKPFHPFLETERI